jgi:hypothetical protein
MYLYDFAFGFLIRSHDRTFANMSDGILAVISRRLIFAALIVVSPVIRPVPAEAHFTHAAAVTSIEYPGLFRDPPAAFKKKIAINPRAVAIEIGQALRFSENTNSVVMSNADPRLWHGVGIDLKATNYIQSDDVALYKVVGGAIQDAIRRQKILRGHPRATASSRCREG